MIRVVVAEDEHLIREALVSLLRLEGDIEIVGEAASGDEALVLTRRLAPDVAVLDLQMPGLSGTEVAAALTADGAECGCVIVTSHGLPGHVKQALASGVRGFVPKTVSGSRLAEVIRAVHAGGRYVDPQLAADAIAAGDSPLTPRETDVLTAADDGSPVEEIARRVSLSPGTVRNYLSSAIAKLHAGTRHEAVRIARSRGWI